MKDAQLWFNKCQMDWSPSLSDTTPEDVSRHSSAPVGRNARAGRPFVEIQDRLEEMHSTYSAQVDASCALRQQSLSD